MTQRWAIAGFDHVKVGHGQVYDRKNNDEDLMWFSSHKIYKWCILKVKTRKIDSRQVEVIY